MVWTLNSWGLPSRAGKIGKGGVVEEEGQEEEEEE